MKLLAVFVFFLIGVGADDDEVEEEVLDSLSIHFAKCEPTDVTFDGHELLLTHDTATEEKVMTIITTEALSKNAMNLLLMIKCHFGRDDSTFKVLIQPIKRSVKQMCALFKKHSKVESAAVNVLGIVIAADNPDPYPVCQTFNVNASTFQMVVPAIVEEDGQMPYNVSLFVNNRRSSYFIEAENSSKMLLDVISAVFNPILTSGEFDFRFQPLPRSEQIVLERPRWKLGVFLAITIGFVLIVILGTVFAYKQETAQNDADLRQFKAQNVRQQRDYGTLLEHTSE